MSPTTRNFVICETKDNVDQFYFGNLFVPSNPIQIHFKKGARQLGFRWDGFMDRVIRSQAPDILHSHFGNLGWFNTLAAMRHCLQHVVTFYGMDVNRLPVMDPRWKGRYRDMFRSVHLVLCEGPHMGDCIQRLGCPENKVRIQRIGVNLDSLPFRPRQWLRGETLRLLIIGGFREKKGIPIALEAFGRLKPRFDAFEVTIVGDAIHPDEQKEKRKIIDAISRFGLGSCTKLAGFLRYEQTLEALYSHHLLVAPSVTAQDGDTEGGAPVTILEAAASGMPVVSTRHCDIPNVLGPINADLLSPERDPAGLADTIETLLEMPWKELTLENRRFIETHHDPQSLSHRLEELYRSVLNGH